ncbi:unnamed protein product [Microthlaspi erraticum]|uniref:Uncharacterized protein n=1 Tax=Microthlaspi erraticum TaxID=1685480 RepID=A0A6D2KN12_9BRAS|nr:unnamed protein product [Microthlaspi erraticum]
MDVSLILGIPTSHISRHDSMGWFFTQKGRYTVKSGYAIAQQTLEAGIPTLFGPDTLSVQAQVWKVQLLGSQYFPSSSTIKHDTWQGRESTYRSFEPALPPAGRSYLYCQLQVDRACTATCRSIEPAQPPACRSNLHSHLQVDRTCTASCRSIELITAAAAEIDRVWAEL